MKKRLIDDARLISSRDPAAKSTLEVVLLYPGFHALVFHRIAHWFYQKRRFFIARFISQFSRHFTGIEIHPGAEIGSGLFIDHGMGIVIGESAIIGDNCTIYHGVTLGGTGKEKGTKRHPTIGNNVLIGTGAKVLGPCKIGDNSAIGANTFVSFDVEPYSTVVGAKGRIVKKRNLKVGSPSEELDQIHMPDPISQEICMLTTRLEHIEDYFMDKNHRPCTARETSDSDVLNDKDEKDVLCNEDEKTKVSEEK